MTGNDFEVTAFTPAHGLPAVDTLVQAFADDPVASHLFPDALERRTGMAHTFRMGLRYGQKYGRVDLIKCEGTNASTGADAVAVWICPEYTTPSWTRWVQAGLLSSPLFMGWSATWRMLRFERFIETCRLRAVDGPHWFLFCIGVHPDQQGRGLGAALIHYGLKRVLQSGIPCYLETAKERNLAFYQKNGFRLLGQKQVPDFGPGVWSLIADSDPSLADSAIHLPQVFK